MRKEADAGDGSMQTRAQGKEGIHNQVRHPQKRSEPDSRRGPPA